MKAYLRRLPSALGAVLTLATLAFASSGVAAQTAPVSMPGEIIIKVSLDASATDVQQLAEKAKCNLVRAIPYCPNYYLFRLKSVTPGPNKKPLVPSADLLAGIDTLKKESKVYAAEPNYMVFKDALRPQTGSKSGVTAAKQTAPISLAKKSRATQPPSSVTAIPNDPYWGRMWGMRAIRMPEAWAIQFGAVQAVIGVADTGIDINHPDFKNPDGNGSRIILARNFIDDAGGTPDPGDFNDREGHGTHVAGTTGATTNNELGVPGVGGWNRGNTNIRLKIARVLGTDGGTQESVSAGIAFLTDEGVDVINLSLGGEGTSQLQTDTIARAVAAGVTVVAATGNDNLDNAVTPHYPAETPGVIAVSSVGPTLTKASYSNYGGQVAIAAPGGDGPEGSDDAIWSTWPTSLSPTGYASINGTSMACPHVAGAVAVLIAGGAPRNAASIKAILQENAIPLDEPPNFAGGNKYGAGLLDVYSALLPFSDPPFSLTLIGPLDLGKTYTQALKPFVLQAIGVTRAPAPASITLEIQTATIPSSTVRTLVGGRDFTVPTSLPEGSPKATPVTFTIPDAGAQPIILPPGRFKILLKLNGTVIGTQYIEIVTRTQPMGRTMFAYPFQARQGAPTSPEQAVLGPTSQFTLARYNSVRLPSDFDYALFQSNGDGRHDAAASFNATAPDGSPLVYATDNSATSIAPVGIGYWLNIDRAITLNVTGPEVTTPVAIRLYAGNNGWNMIGAPFTAPTPWAGVAVRTASRIYTMEEAIAAGVISSALIGYTNGDYVYEVYPSGTLQPFQAYWVRVYQDCTLIVAPSSQTTRSVNRSTLPPVNGWRARLGANVAGDRDGQNYFGQAQGAEGGVDRYDIPKPPSGAGHAYVRFLTETTPGRQVAQAFDMRSAGNNNAEWTAAISTDRTNADVTVTWDSLGNLPNRSDLILTDVATGKTVDMRARSNYTYRSGDAGSTRQFLITMKSRLSSGPLALRNVIVQSGGRSNQTGLSVRFSTSRDADVTGVIKALNGTVVGNLAGSSRASATNQATLRWNGRTRSGNMAPPGPYIVEITARASDGSVAAFSQPVQNMQ